MKFLYTTSIITAILAAVVPALPVADAEVNSAATLQKRDSASFSVYTDSSCSGGSVGFTTGSATQKGNFGATQRSIRVTSLTPGYHVTFYSGLKQGGDKSQYGSATVGQCFSNVAFLSWAYYAGA
ncbi:hypothetical protein SBOR_8714 [Sclerotinia borealis F-4128]|uniref:Uncharacterized protein n=1 Tax=Sclerotinia borealis (strain F-4128) TaxID=1432307 RepID=W9C297_SCLBF|nr:hypothetical protein SBOR_8714 [Sclerotinia borealis F-4128]